MHCIGMCGPIALALPVGSYSRSRFLAGRLLYNAGRVVTYAAIGAVVGLFGGKLLLPVLQQDLSIIVGATVLISVLVPLLFRKVTLAKILQPFYDKVSRGISALMRNPSGGAMLGLGLLNGLLPCGFVYLAVAGALVSSNLLGGMLFMTGFGCGTIPAMLGVSLFPGFISLNVRTRLARVLPVFTAIVGVLLIVRGLNLGIPYLSPKISQHQHSVSGDCCKE
jgi:sulfite exporter TauE/SafE